MTRSSPLPAALMAAALLTGCGKKDSASQAGGAKDTYKRKAMSTEAKLTLGKIATGARFYFERGAVVSRSGKVLPTRFPTAPPTPAKVPCGKRPETVTLSPPQKAAWSAVGVDFADPVRYQYQILSSGTGRDAAFTARAVGDLDCDGAHATYELTGRVDAELRVKISKLRIVQGLE